MTKRTYVVRVVQTEDNEGGHINGAFLDCLRYAGFVRTHEVDPHGHTALCFDLVPPDGVESQSWADRNAARMRSFGFNAVSAPSTV